MCVYTYIYIYIHTYLYIHAAQQLWQNIARPEINTSDIVVDFHNCVISGVKHFAPNRHFRLGRGLIGGASAAAARLPRRPRPKGGRVSFKNMRSLEHLRSGLTI